MSDNDSPLEDDEVESLVYVEFEGIAGNEIYAKGNVKIDMIGIDTDHPIMRVNDRYYEGTYEDAVGTYMFFGKDENPVIDDPVFDIPPKLKYNTKTRKVLKMKRIFVKPRLEVLGDSNHPGCVPNIETIKEAGVPPVYQEEALNSWNKMRNDRVDALNKYLEKHRIRDQKRQQGIVPDSDSDDDNPFAMYKSKVVDEAPSDQLSKLTVQEPTPSTSQDNVSSSNAESSNQQTGRTDKPSSGYVAIPPTKQPRGKVRKRSNAKSRSVDSRSGEQMEIAQLVDNVEPIPEEIGSDHPRSEDISEMEGNLSPERSEPTDNNEDYDEDDDDDDVMALESPDKKLEKQMKRNAKSKEIQERLKQTADKMKSQENK